MSDFVIENGALKKYTGNGGDVTIPHGVTEIGRRAFYKCSKLTSVSIPDSVTSIGYSAFSECTSLTSVTIPKSVKNIEEDAFGCCTSLTSITIPNNIMNRDFWRCFRWMRRIDRFICEGISYSWQFWKN